MVVADKKARSSTGAVQGDPAETKFLRSMPWILDAIEQEPDTLMKSLQFEASRFKELARQPTFSLLAVLRDTKPRHLQELILSVRCQSYESWQLVLVDDGSRSREHLEIAGTWASQDSRIRLRCLEWPVGPSRSKNLAIEESTGDFLILVDGDGVLHPMALGVMARHINDDPQVNFVFSNEAEINSHSTSLGNFLLKPPLDLFTLLRISYVSRLFAVERGLLRGPELRCEAFHQAYDGIEEHDLLIRLVLSRSVVSRHAPMFTYYSRAGSRAMSQATAAELAEKRRQMLAEHVPRIYPRATWTAKVSSEKDSLAATNLWITDLPELESPKLLIVIPFKDQIETTIKCLESIERQVHRLDVVVALVNNRSIEPGTLPRLRDWTNKQRMSRYEILYHDGAFNFARLNNAAIARLGRERDLILFLNNDVELLTPQALQTMAMQLLADPGIGFVGLKLLYPGGTEIQHGGVRFVEDTYGSGYYMLSLARHASEFVDAERVSLCVTFACAMTRRETFEKLGGLEEVFLPNSLGDADLCLRALDAGYRNYYFGSLTGIHHESISRGHVNEDIEYSALHERHGKIIASWRHRHLNRCRHVAWPLLMLPYDEPGTAYEDKLPCHGAEIPRPPLRVKRVSPFRLPLRYRLADLAVNILNVVLGPVYGYLRTRLLRAGKRARKLITPGSVYSSLRMMVKPLPFLGPASAFALRSARRLASGTRSLRILARQLWRDSSGCSRLAAALRAGGYHGFLEELSAQVPTLQLEPYLASVRFKRCRPSQRQLEKLRSEPWPASSPRVTIVMPVYNIRETWLRQAVESILAQTYPHWELICVNDASPAPHIRIVLDELASRDGRVRVLHCTKNRGVSVATNLGIKESRGDYVCFMDHDDYLEPHALHRFAQAILEVGPDMLYSDEAITKEDIDKILRIDSRPAFSYDHYLGHPYFVHLIAVRTELVRKVGGLNESMSISQDVDLNLRLIEVCQTICHIPEALYRWRTHPASLGHQKMDQCRAMTRGALERHFARTDQNALFEEETHFNFRDVRFQHDSRARVAIVIATATRADLLNSCLGSLERTVDPALAEIVVMDRSLNDDRRERNQGVNQKHHIVSSSGTSNGSAIMNTAVAALRGSYTHYLFLSSEIEATAPGWLEHMLGYGQRNDVGVVGALLLGSDQAVRHSGLIVSMDGQVGYALEGFPFRHWIAGRNPGPNGSLLASRDVSAVTAACMLVRADLFHRLNGFDDELPDLYCDADFCLRASALGFKVVQDAYAILYQRGSKPCASILLDRHSDLARRFHERHREFITQGDPFSIPTTSRRGLPTSFKEDEEKAPLTRRPRTRRVALPQGVTATKMIRMDAQVTDVHGRGPHHTAMGDPIQTKAVP